MRLALVIILEFLVTLEVAFCQDNLSNEKLRELLEDYLSLESRRISEEKSERISKKIQGSKPHVVMFLIDDMGFNDIFWNNKLIKMPYTESLAKDGKILDQAYSGPVCSPSRGTLMSGLYAHKIGMTHMVYNGAKSECLKTDVKLLPAKLGDVGYATHMVGKWHLGFCGKECTPIGRGFDTFYGFYHGAVDHYSRKTVFDSQSVSYDWHDITAKDPKSWGPDNGKARDDTYYANDLLTERAVDIIKAADPEVPMFLYYSSPLIHTPMEVDESYLDEVPLDAGSKKRRTFIAMAKALDVAIEKVVETLKAKNMYDNAVIIFHSDNGGEAHFGSNQPLRGAKTSYFEGGIRVPSFIHSKLMPKSERGTKSQGMFFIADWHSTIMELAGVEQDKENPLDAVPQVEFLFKGKESKRTEFIPGLDMYYPELFGVGAIRSGDYKLIVGWPGLVDGYEGNGTLSTPFGYDFFNINDEIEKRGGYTLDYGRAIKYMNACKNKIQLYNIKKDPFEEHDLSQNDNFVRIAIDIWEKFNKESENFYKFNRAADKEDAAGLPKNNGDAWVTGWCPDGPLSNKLD